MITAAAAVLAAALTALGVYLATRRKSSGRIATSDAADLWAESQAMRKELRVEVTQLRSDLADVRAAHASCTEEVRHLRAEVERLQQIVETNLD